MAALAIGLIAVSCSHDTDLYDQSVKERESAENFVNLVLGGQQVDPNQTWSTANGRELTVSSQVAEGTLKVYTVNPIGHSSAPLLTTTLAKGETKRLKVTCPNDVQRLYVVVYDAQNYLRMEVVDVTEGNLSVSFEAEENLPASTRRAPGNYWTNSHQFLSTPNASTYAESVPTGVAYLGDYKDPWGGYQLYHFNLPNNTCWLDQAAIDRCGMNFSKNGYTIYVKGTVSCSNDFYLSYQSKIYLTKGAKLILPGTDYSFGQSDVQIIVADGAELVCNGKMQFSNTKLYNNGTVTTQKLEFAGSGKVYNSAKGTLDVKQLLTIANNNCEVVNDGILEVPELQVNGSGHFMNNNQATITGNAVVNSNNNSWVNNGTFHCNNFLYNGGGSYNVINNCKLICDKQFYIGIGQNQGEFKLDGSVECNTFFHGIGFTKMTGKSIIKVAETLTCHADADGCYFGFYGPESADNGYAVIQAKKITATNLTQRRSITYRNYLIVATDDHWEQCDKNNNQVNGNYPYWDQGNNVKMAKSKDDIDVTIEPTDCNAGIGGKEVIIIDEPTQYFYYAFEDLGTTDDFDFNDVIIRLSAPVNGQSSVELVAAGGTLETYVAYGEGENPTRLGPEVHTAMGENSTNVMINTSSVDTGKFAVLGTVNIADDADMTNLPFSILVKGNYGETTKVTRLVNQGQAPLVIVVNGNDEGKWFWPTERTNIAAAYQDFGDWGANVSLHTDWYKRATSGMVVNY